MPVVTLREILKNAGREKYAVGMFDVHHSDMAEAVLEAAEERNAPVILALAEVHAVQPGQLTAVGSMLVQAAERAGVPVAVHLDRSNFSLAHKPLRHYSQIPPANCGVFDTQGGIYGTMELLSVRHFIWYL